MEFDLQAITEEWVKDAEINELDLADAARATPRLHAKYLSKLSFAKLHLQRLSIRYDKMRGNRYRYYRGEMSKDELVKYSWTQWQGNKPIKSEMDEFLKGDDELKKIEELINYQAVIVSTLESILKGISSRGWDVRTTLDAKKFYNGG